MRFAAEVVHDIVVDAEPGAVPHAPLVVPIASVPLAVCAPLAVHVVVPRSSSDNTITKLPVADVTVTLEELPVPFEYAAFTHGVT